MSLASDKKDADVASTTTTAQDDDNLSTYHGFDHHVQDQVRQLARTLTQQSSLHQKKEHTLPEEGINPIFTNTEADDYNPRLDPTSDEFSSAEWVQNMSNISNSDPDYYKPYSLGCYWKDLVATGESADIEYQANFLNGPYKGLKTVYNTVVPSTASSKDKNFKILKSMEGAVNPGELLVVLGRPGSGCTTLLKSISSNTHGFNIAKESTISYSGMTPNDIRKHFRGEVVYNAEADIHLPHLTVYQTLLTVARLKTPQNRLKGIDRETYARHLTEVAMATFGLSHTRTPKSVTT